jgi:hypothetical protein
VRRLHAEALQLGWTAAALAGLFVWAISGSFWMGLLVAEIAAVHVHMKKFENIARVIADDADTAHAELIAAARAAGSS